MVSGFLTSPLDHARIWSGVASPIRSSSKKFTSSTVAVASSAGRRRQHGQRFGVPDSVEISPGRLAPGQIDAKLHRRPEHVLVGLAELDLLSRRRTNLDVQAEGLHLLDQDLERL